MKRIVSTLLCLSVLALATAMTQGCSTTKAEVSIYDPAGDLLCGISTNGLSIASIFSSNMVLQRERDVPIWGWAAPGSEVSVSFDNSKASTIADGNGNWQVKLPPMKASHTPRTLVVSSENTVNTMTNILVGDVWICSGQSNMEMSFSWKVYQGDYYMAEATNYPSIRRIKVNHKVDHSPRPDINTSGWIAAKDSMKGCTATGYFFARMLNRETNIPIGIIDNSWSGSAIEPYIPPATFKKYPSIARLADEGCAVDPTTKLGAIKYKEYLAKVREWADTNEKALLTGRRPNYNIPKPPDVTHGAKFNGMVSPITRFAIKGVIWYQGCANGNLHNSAMGATYTDKMDALVSSWRSLWGYEFPFYWVQLASFTRKTTDPAGGNGYAYVRQAQFDALSRIKNGGMAVTIDIGNDRDIHPKAKKQVGERLARWALARDYGKDIVPSGPLFKSAKIEEGKIRISFDYVGTGLMVGVKKATDNLEPQEAPKGTPLKGFAIADKDKVWHWANAVIDGDTVVVSSDKVPSPSYVRYAFRAFPQGDCNLYNREGLPASPFKTDNN